MTYTWDNRVDFVVRFMYDIDNNGFLDDKDFECMAVRAAVIEGKGVLKQDCLDRYRSLMKSLWEEISNIADEDRDGKISNDEFKGAVATTCVGKNYTDFPQTMKAFIEANFKMVDLNGDGIISGEEFRYNCITRIAVDDIKVVDDAFNRLLNDDDRKRGGLTMARYQELYAHYLGNKDENNPGITLFGPLN